MKKFLIGLYFVLGFILSFFMIYFGLYQIYVPVANIVCGVALFYFMVRLLQEFRKGGEE